MPCNDEFLGSAFAVASARAIGPATVRVTFTQDPKVVSASGADDALNPLNYTLSGPSDNYVTSVSVVTGDPQSVDLFVAAPFEVGEWTITGASAIASDQGFTLGAPAFGTFSVVILAAETPLSGGAENDDAYGVLRKFFNPALRGQSWDSVLHGVASGDAQNWTNAQAIFNQLFASSASGTYLDRRGADVGQKRPADVGLSDELFRRLIVAQTASKLTQEALLEVLDIFYGVDAVRSSILTDLAEPYDLQDGDTLQLVLDRTETVIVPFAEGEFARIGEATAVEVASAITRSLLEARSQAYAVAVKDEESGLTKVRIYSSRRGVGSSIQIAGGRAQTKLRFPKAIFTSSGGSPFAVWNVTLSPDTPGNLRFSKASGIYDLSLLQEGDIAYIYGTEFEPTSCIGSFEVQAVHVSYPGGTPVMWFEVTNPAGDAASSISQLRFESLMFFRPVRRTIYDVVRSAIVAQRGSVCDVVMPATTQAVSRSAARAAYVPSSSELEATEVRRVGETVTVTTSGAHGLQAGDQVMIDDALPDGESPTAVAGTPSGAISGGTANGTTNRSVISATSDSDTFEGVFHRAVRLPEGMVAVLGGETQAPGPNTAIANPFIFSVTSDTTLTTGRQIAYTWRQLAHTLTISPREFGISVLADGRVVATGGHNGSGTASSAVDILTYTATPAQNYLTSGTMSAARAAHGQVTLQDGRVFIAGGWTADPATAISTSEVFNGNDTWTARASLQVARMGHEMVLLNNGQVLAIGGRQSSAAYLNQCEIYTVNANSWAHVGRMTFARAGAKAIVIPDGRVVVIGGRGYHTTRSTTVTDLKSCEIYDPATRLWLPLPDMSEARPWPIAEYVESLNAIVVAGGEGNTKIEILDLATLQWRKSIAGLQPGYYRSAGALAGDDVMVICGGSQVTDAGTETGNTAADGFVWVPGDETIWSGGLNRTATVESVPSANQFTYQTHGQSGYVLATGTVLPMKAPDAPEGIPGPFVFDREGAAVTDTEGSLAASLEQDRQYTSITLGAGEADSFPDEPGYLAFRFGFSDAVYPVRYLRRLSATELLIDSEFRFPTTVAAGSKVTLLKDRVPFQPERDALLGSFYLTAAAAGRIAAQQALEETAAAGMGVNFEVTYPGDQGLGGEGLPARGASKLSDKVAVWGGDDLDEALGDARNG